MNVFKVMDGEFGTDGLISSHPVAPAFATADQAYRYIAEESLRGNIWSREFAPGYWVEEHTDPDRNSAVWVTHPYPSVKMILPPDWFKTEMAEWTKPTKEEHDAWLASSLRAATALGAAAGERERAAREAKMAQA